MTLDVSQITHFRTKSFQRISARAKTAPAEHDCEDFYLFQTNRRFSVSSKRNILSAKCVKRDGYLTVLADVAVVT